MDFELGVDALGVSPHRVQRHHELIGDFRSVEVRCEQSKHVELAFTQRFHQRVGSRFVRGHLRPGAAERQPRIDATPETLAEPCSPPRTSRRRGFATPVRKNGLVRRAAIALNVHCLSPDSGLRFPDADDAIKNRTPVPGSSGDDQRFSSPLCTWRPIRSRVRQLITRTRRRT